MSDEIQLLKSQDLATIIFIIGSLIFLLPFYWMIIASTFSDSDIYKFPPRLLPGTQFLANVKDLLLMIPYSRNFLNSIFVASVRTLLNLFFCSLVGFAFAKYSFAGKNWLFAFILGTMMIPGQVTLVPWFIMMSWFGWVNSFKALIIPNMISAFGVFWMRQYITSTIPDELLDAARIDGYGEFAIYTRIVMPLIRPGLGALGIYVFMGSWNDFMQPLIILKEVTKYTLPVAMAALQGNLYYVRYPVLMAAATIAVVPILIVYALANKQFIAGLTAGSIRE